MRPQVSAPRARTRARTHARAMGRQTTRALPSFLDGKRKVKGSASPKAGNFLVEAEQVRSLPLKKRAEAPRGPPPPRRAGEGLVSRLSSPSTADPLQRPEAVAPLIESMTPPGASKMAALSWRPPRVPNCRIAALPFTVMAPSGRLREPGLITSRGPPVKLSAATPLLRDSMTPLPGFWGAACIGVSRTVLQLPRATSSLTPNGLVPIICVDGRSFSLLLQQPLSQKPGPPQSIGDASAGTRVYCPAAN